MQWLHDHPAGWVLNSRRRHDPTYMVLHRTSCYSINRAIRHVDKSSFTKRKDIKVCSEDPNALILWIGQHGGSGFTKRCFRCGA
jgi:hypothetical protein